MSAVVYRRAPGSLAHFLHDAWLHKHIHSPLTRVLCFRTPPLPQQRAYSTQVPCSNKADSGQGNGSKASAVKARLKRNVQGPNLLEQSKVQSYLAQIEATKDDLALDDLERLRPVDHSDPRVDPGQYEQQHMQLVDTLTRSFSKSQLSHFLRLYGFKMSVAWHKRKIAVKIVEQQWGWPSLTKHQELKRNAGEQFIGYPMDVQEAFLVWGKDGCNILSLAREYRLQLWFSSSPLLLNVQGPKEAVQDFVNYLKEFKDDIVIETIHLPLNHSLSPEKAQSITRVSGVYLETSSTGKVVVTFSKRDPGRMHTAKRLAFEAVCDSFKLQTSLIQLAPTESDSLITFPLNNNYENRYSLYPFISTQSLLRDAELPAEFRLRRVGQWFDDPRNKIDPAPPLKYDSVILSLTKDAADLKEHLAHALEGVLEASPSRVISASSGHFLLSGQPPKTSGLLPPLRGTVSPSDILHWIQNNPLSATFRPSLPGPAMTLPQHRHKFLRRLRYVSQPPVEPLHDVVSTTTSKNLILEIAPRLEEINVASDVPQIHCQQTLQEIVNLLMPDQPLDLQFLVSDVDILSRERIPPMLLDFIERIETSPASEMDRHIPLTFTLSGETYVLQSNLHVQQTYRDVPQSDLDPDYNVKDRGLIVEIIEDRDKGESTSLTKVVCEDFASNSSWESFLQKCVWLSRISANGRR